MERTVTTVWPTIGALALGRWVGRLGGFSPPGDRFRLIGRCLALATIPISLAVYAWQLMPFITRCYRLTSERIVVLAGLQRREQRSVALDAFDAIEIEILPGQAWLHAGELVFRRQEQEVFRLSGVSRPDVFRAVCWKAQAAVLLVRRTVAAQAAAGAPA